MTSQVAATVHSKQPPAIIALTMTATNRHLTAQGIVKSFGDRHVLGGVDVTVRAGELVALLGPNGSGKTTLLSIMSGLAQGDAGTIGHTPQSVGWVPQGGATYGRLTVRENLEMFARLGALRSSKRRTQLGSSTADRTRASAKDNARTSAEDRARASAERAELMPWFNTLSQELSGGLRQRLNVAVGMLDEPPALILDEPTTGVDLIHRHQLWSVLRACAAGGGAVIYSAHTMEDAAIADRIIVLVNGVISYDGKLNDIADFVEEPPGMVERTSFAQVADRRERALLQLWSAQR